MSGSDYPRRVNKSEVLEGGVRVGREGDVMELSLFEAANDNRVANEPAGPKEVNTLFLLSARVEVWDDRMEDAVD